MLILRVKFHGSFWWISNRMTCTLFFSSSFTSIYSPLGYDSDMYTSKKNKHKRVWAIEWVRNYEDKPAGAVRALVV